MENESNDSEFGARAGRQLMDIYITPEVMKRQESGLLPKPLNLTAAQIIFYPDGRRPLVRINNEVKAFLQVRFKEIISKKIGDEVLQNEIEKIENIKLVDEENPNCGHATLIKFAQTWTIAFDARYNKGESKKTIDVAREFFEAAKYSLDQENFSAYTDNLFSCCELLAKALLLSFPDPDFKCKTNHKAIKSRFNRIVQIGNFKPEYREVFNHLTNIRCNARYLDEELNLDFSTAQNSINIVEDMISYCDNWIKT